MLGSEQFKNRFRYSFGRIQTPPMPHLLDMQVQSYERFLQKNTDVKKRKVEGLDAVFRSVFPISDYSGSTTLEYVNYRLGDPVYMVDECRVRGFTYSAPLRVSLRLIVWEKEAAQDGTKQIHDIKEQDIYLGEIPLMTDSGSFVINGTERVIVCQMHKSPGVVVLEDHKNTQLGGSLLYTARIIPQRGSWLDFEFDGKNMLNVRIDRKRKFHATVLLRALGYEEADLIKRFYLSEDIDLSEALGVAPEERQFYTKFNAQTLQGQRASLDILAPKDDKILLHAGRKMTRIALKRLEEAGISRIPLAKTEVVERYTSDEVCNANGDVLASVNTFVSEALLDQMIENGVKTLPLIHIGENSVGDSLRQTLEADGMESVADAMLDLYKRLKPGDPATMEAARSMLSNLFFSAERYSLSRVGRMKINKKLGSDTNIEQLTLDHDDILRTVEYLLRLKEGVSGTVDDIDHLGNRRVRGVGELLENQFRIGLVRMERAIKERMNLHETESMMLHDIVNAKSVSAAINEFFGSGQLSQFMDQTNPLAEITHKRRLSALGPGGLTREWAGFDVRDVHASHYGRICPIETPEGPNIGLIASLATHASINDFGFIESPYHPVKEGAVSAEVNYLSAIEEDQYKVAQANAPLDGARQFRNPLVSARHKGEYEMIGREEIDYMDVAPHQLVSAAAALIPFLEHDDANRALMGSNMQRQAVPLIKPSAPLVGTGMERKVAIDSGACLIAKRAGVVNRLDSARIVIQADVNLSDDSAANEPNVDIYHLAKFQRSNQNICINQRPIVKANQRVQEGDIIADGPSCDQGDLALGQNLTVAFMPWNGYNFEDSILISERVVREDLYTSIHIEEAEVVARETKLGREEITRDIPNVGEDSLRYLDESGIVRVGTYVKGRDILVGKVTPKGETQLNPEEKLLRAIFGERAGDVRDTSLRTPQSIDGVVIKVVTFNRKGVDKDERTKEIENTMYRQYKKDHQDEARIVRLSMLSLLAPMLKGQELVYDITNASHDVLFQKGSAITSEVIEKIPLRSWGDVHVGDDRLDKQITRIIENALAQIDLLEKIYEDRCQKLERGDEMPPGVIRMIKVYIAVKRKLSVGDKMAGRHGNKGVVSRIESIENMPYVEDGTPVDIVLNPLGVPSRMNVGQVLETHLGWVAAEMGKQVNKMMAAAQPLKPLRTFLKQAFATKGVQTYFDGLNDEDLAEKAKDFCRGFHFATPVFDGAREEDLQSLFSLAQLPSGGQVRLYDGLTGDAFEQPVTVGCIYMMKLNHLVDDKIHARSIGPYSLVTQQPLGGKAQFGGQRFGEMEVWALEAYGASYTLQELLTVKSDDITGRNRIYESIVKGNYVLETGLPESFKVLVNELKSLCLDVKIG